MPERAIKRRRPPQPLVLIPVKDGEYDDDADILEMSAKIQEFLYGVSKGYSTNHACALSGCKEDAVYRWLNPKHKNFKPKLHTLFKRARAVFYSKQVDKIAQSKDWKAALAWLEKHEADWHPKEAHISMNATLPALHMDAETVNALSAAYDERMSKTAQGEKKVQEIPPITKEKNEIHT